MTAGYLEALEAILEVDSVPLADVISEARSYSTVKRDTIKREYDDVGADHAIRKVARALFSCHPESLKPSTQSLRKLGRSEANAGKRQRVEPQRLARRIVGEAFLYLLDDHPRAYLLWNRLRHEVKAAVREARNGNQRAFGLSDDEARRRFDELAAATDHPSLKGIDLPVRSFIRRCGRAAQMPSASDWLHPSCLIEGFFHRARAGTSSGFYVPETFSTDFDWMVVKVNTAFLQAMPFHTWPPPTEKRHRRGRISTRKPGLTRIHFVEFLGAAVASYFAGDPVWCDLGGELSEMIVALGKCGNELCGYGGPKDDGEIYSRNFVSILEIVRAAAQSIDREAMLKLWFVPDKLPWWNPDWWETWAEPADL